MQAALVIFSKPPLPGKTKNRLRSRLSAADAALFHRACLADLCAVAGDLPFKTFIFLADGSSNVFTRSFPEPVPLGFAELCSMRFDGIDFKRQQGQHLGERLNHAAALVLRSFSPVMLIGSDLPDLTPELLLSAAGNLSEHDLVIGPAVDGGYYLIGLTEACPALFQGITWGTDQVLKETLQAACDQRLRVCLLPPARDVDTWEDLVNFAQRGMADQGRRRGVADRLAAYLIEKYEA